MKAWMDIAATSGVCLVELNEEAISSPVCTNLFFFFFFLMIYSLFLKSKFCYPDGFSIKYKC